MKKVLFTTTALVAFAGAASAEVSLSGSAEMGIKGGSGMETQFESNVDVRFTLSGETDGGLTFGATIDLDEAAGTKNSKESVFISGSFGTVTLGDTDGAFDWALQEVGVGDTLTDDHTSHIGYNGNGFADAAFDVTFPPALSFNLAYDGQVLRYNNTFGDFGVAVSAQLDDRGIGGTSFGIGFKYNAALGGVDLGFGLAYQQGDLVRPDRAAAGPTAGPDGLDGTADDTPAVVALAGAVIGDWDTWGLSVDAKFAGGFRAILNYSDTSVGAGSVKHTAIGVAYTKDALTLSANWGKHDLGLIDVSGFGVAVNYDLGGGAVAQLGYGRSSFGPLSANTWSAGLGFSF